MLTAGRRCLDIVPEAGIAPASLLSPTFQILLDEDSSFRLDRLGVSYRDVKACFAQAIFPNSRSRRIVASRNVFERTCGFCNLPADICAAGKGGF